jgi:mannose-1-phosphate guanylyltransferase
MIPALVLTAGLATRLRPLSLVRAKAALPVAGQPLAHRILRWLAAAGVRDAVLNLHHLPHTLTGLIGDGSSLGMRVRYSWEMPVLGSAGGPRRALPILGAPSVLIVNGDTLTNVSVSALVAAHERSDALATLAVVPNTDGDKYGGVLVDDDGTVRGFTKRGSGEPSYHFVGVQVASAAAFAAVPDGAPAEVFREAYPALMAQRPGAVRAYVTGAEFFDIGTPSDYLQTSLLLAARERREGQLIGARARIEATARIESSVLWDDVEVGAGALVRECVVTDGATVPADTSWMGVSLRPANGELASNETRIGNLAVADL